MHIPETRNKPKCEILKQGVSKDDILMVWINGSLLLSAMQWQHF